MAAVLGGSRCTTEIPEQSMLVNNGGDGVKDIVAVFPQKTHLWIWDRRLAGTELMPYWPWAFQVDRSVGTFAYQVTLSIMGSPEEGLKYREKSKAGWRRPQLEDWAAKMLNQFEVDNQTAFSQVTELDETALKQLLISWFERSKFANQGIHIAGIAAARRR